MEQKALGIMIDCSRDGVYTVETLKKFFDVLADMGYTSVQLYTEDVYELDDEPYFGYLRGKYSKTELKELDRYAVYKGLELIPCIQTLAHLGGITRWSEYRQCTDIGDILLTDDESTYRLIEKMFCTCAECFTSRRINIGMDEAHMVGLGKHLDRFGYQNRYDILFRHLDRVNAIAARYGFRPMMWSDMIFRMNTKGMYGPCTFPQEVIDLVPENIELIYWDYYSVDYARYDDMLTSHEQLKRKTIFAGSAWSHGSFVPANRFSVRASAEAVKACRAHGVDEAIVTIWKDGGAECPLFASLPSLFAFAEYWRGNFDLENIKTKFEVAFGIAFDTFLALDFVNLYMGDDYPRNPAKYMFYSDPFLGIFDVTVDEKNTRVLEKNRATLRLAKDHSDYGYIFRTLLALSDVMKIKYALGVRTRRAYIDGDRRQMKRLLKEYKLLIKRLLVFYRRFLEQWNTECKPYGFEKQDIRLGGLIRRVWHCREMLDKFRRGKIDSIPLLEEEILPNEREVRPGQFISNSDYHNIAMIKPFS